MSDREQTEQTGEGARLLSYLAIAAAAVFLFFKAAALPTSQFAALGAAAFPRLVMGTLVALCLLAAAGSLRRLGGLAPLARLAPAAVDWAVRRRLVFAVVAFFAVYLALVRGAGFGPSTFAFLAVAQALLSPRTLRAWGIGLALALIFSFGLDWLFAEVFNVFLPRGRWW